MVRKPKQMWSIAVVTVLLASRPSAAFSSSRSLVISTKQRSTSTTLWLSLQDRERQRIEEESRLQILASRRTTIRGTLKAAELLKNFRIEKGKAKNMPMVLHGVER
jgi:hypothetical protein